MDITKSIKMAQAYAGMSEADLARKLGTTPQAFGQRMKTGKFSSADLEKIAAALGAKVAITFTFPDGKEV